MVSRRLVIVSNRVEMPAGRPARAGGLVTALREALFAQGGLWFGWSGEIAEKSSEVARLESNGDVIAATVDLSRVDHGGYYVGYANGALWPILHCRPGLVEFKRHDFEGYLEVNAKFARALMPLLRADDLVWVHDYHLIPLGRELRRLGAANRLGFFLHTPFPPAEVLAMLPQADTVMAGLCSYDLVGFQTAAHADAFLRGVGALAGGRHLGLGRFVVDGRRSRAAAFPIGIETERFASLGEQAANSVESNRLRESLRGRDLVIGVDRLDYTKGLPGRIEATAALLTQWPEYRRRFNYLQIAPHSRAEVRRYRELRQELEAAVGRVNGKFAEFDWSPIRYVNRSFSRRTLAGFYRIARIGLVTPLQDGMNLVAKEFVAAQDEADPGVLVLSRFAGAAVELQGALLVNPLDIDDMALALRKGLAMALEERRVRWASMMAAIRCNTVERWRQSFVAALAAEEPVSASA